MRAARLHEIGGVPRIDEIDPPPGPRLVRVSASTLNPVDVSIGNGSFYGGTPEPPYVIGSESVGETEDGRRVWIRGREMMAELVEAPTDWIFEIPDGVNDGLALGCGIAGLTAWLALSWRVPVEPDDTVLVLGASGTLGSVAVQAAKVLGARRVIGAARRVDAVPGAADEVFDLSRGDEQLPPATLILDGLWGEPLERALASAEHGVRVVHLGQSAGPAATILSAWIRGKAVSIHGFAVFTVPLEIAERGYTELCGHARDGRILLDIESYELDAVADAWARQASGSPGGKIVLRL